MQKLPLEQIPDFFDRLDQIAGGLGDSSASNSQILKLAFQFTENHDNSSFSDMALEGNFSDALHIPISENRIMERLLARMLEEINKRSLTLSPENESLLNDWLAHAKTEYLKEAGKEYTRKRKSS